MKEFFTGILNSIGWAYWVKIETAQPNCTYYFGPFLNLQEAKSYKTGYLEDLNQEGATGIAVEIKRCKPTELTVIKEREENLDFKVVPAFSTQS
jgi:Domain of unknown function (DUF1816)